MKVSAQEYFGLVAVRSEVADWYAEIRIGPGGILGQSGSGEGGGADAMPPEKNDLFQN